MSCSINHLCFSKYFQISDYLIRTFYFLDEKNSLRDLPQSKQLAIGEAGLDFEIL